MPFADEELLRALKVDRYFKLISPQDFLSFLTPFLMCHTISSMNLCNNSNLRNKLKNDQLLLIILVRLLENFGNVWYNLQVSASIFFGVTSFKVKLLRIRIILKYHWEVTG